MIGSVALRTGGTITNCLILMHDGELIPFYQEDSSVSADG